MAAVAPLLLEPTVLEDPPLSALEPDLVDPASLERELAEYNLLLARTLEIPDSVRFFVENLADDFGILPIDATLRTDPYLLVAMQKALLLSLRALENPDLSAARRELRVRLEQLRQVYRDLADARPIYEDRPAKELALWLSEAIDVSQARLAQLLGVSGRTFQRWISSSEEAEPIGEDARRVRVVASLTSHLRHALTGQGVLEWFDRPHPLAGGHKPRDLLDQPDALPRLVRLAASTRSALAS